MERATKLLVIAALAAATAAVAQEREYYGSGRQDARLGLADLAVNASVGAATALIVRAIAGKPLIEGAPGGAFGGATAFAGRYVASRRGLGFVGRQVSALGVAMVRNAGLDHGLFDELIVPVGPIRLFVRTDSLPRVSPRLDLTASVVLLSTLARGDRRLNLKETLSAGTPVFAAQAASPVPGQFGAQSSSVITLWRSHEVPGLPPSQSTHDQWFAHERVHVLQYDFVSLAWLEPVESWLLARTKVGRLAARHFSLNAVGLPLMPLAERLPYDRRPWEWEARFLSGAR